MVLLPSQQLLIKKSNMKKRGRKKGTQGSRWSRQWETNEQGQYFCEHCHTFKDKSEYYFSPSRPSGKDRFCKSCNTQVTAYYRIKRMLKESGSGKLRQKIEEYRKLIELYEKVLAEN